MTEPIRFIFANTTTAPIDPLGHGTGEVGRALSADPEAAQALEAGFAFYDEGQTLVVPPTAPTLDPGQKG